jgi:hypothetical protein
VVPLFDFVSTGKLFYYTFLYKVILRKRQFKFFLPSNKFFIYKKRIKGRGKSEKDGREADKLACNCRQRF